MKMQSVSWSPFNQETRKTHLIKPTDCKPESRITEDSPESDDDELEVLGRLFSALDTKAEPPKERPSQPVSSICDSTFEIDQDPEIAAFAPKRDAYSTRTTPVGQKRAADRLETPFPEEKISDTSREDRSNLKKHKT